MQRAEELRHKQVMASSVHHIMKRGLSKCFASWLGWVTEKVAVRNMLRKTVLRIQNMYVSSAFDSWQSWSSRRRQLRSICAKAVQRMHDMVVSKAWSAWWSHRCKMVRVRQMVVKLRYRAVCGAFETWLGMVASARTAALVAELSLIHISEPTRR